MTQAEIDRLRSPRPLASPTRFIIDVGADGFNAYRIGKEGLELFASSSCMSTFCKVMSDIASAGSGAKVEFKLVDTPQEEPCTT